MVANMAVNGCITANKRCHLVGLPSKTQIHVQPFKSVFSVCGSCWIIRRIITVLIK